MTIKPDTVIQRELEQRIEELQPQLPKEWRVRCESEYRQIRRNYKTEMESLLRHYDQTNPRFP